MLPCPRSACLCAHKDCDTGWILIEYEDVTESRSRTGEVTKTTQKREGAVPCPECLPDRAALFYKAQNKDQLNQLLQRSDKPKESNEPRTRVL